MFGYVRPALSQMSQKQRDLYQSAYCGLCHAMGKRHGFWARFTLNYDLTLLAILLQSDPREEHMVCKRCPVHPLRKPRSCLQGTGMERAADVSIILTWHKVNDDIQDHGFWTGLPHRIVRLLFGRAHRRAAQACPTFDAQVRQGLERLSQLEQEQSPRLDEVAHQFAGILAAAAPTQADQTRNRILEQLLYHVGRWIYLMDAWDDLEEDEAGGRYNPLSTRFQGEAKKEREYVSTTCTHSVRLAANAAQLLDLGEWDEVLSNILCVGLPAVQSAVLDGRWKELKKLHKGRYTHERSV